MANETIIKISNLSKKFRRYSSVGQVIKEVLHPRRKQYHKEFWALRDINIEIKRGESVGIVGRNGSGKSTLLQIICGVLQPTSGSVEVNGRIAALLELGAGFHPEFSGRENVYMNGALMGLSRVEVDERFDKVAAFADIGDFIDQPVRTYSSGMFVRLAFAAAINVDPDILVVDEALSVGDAFFQQKCFNRIKKVKDEGGSVIFISHDMNAVKTLCDRAILLDKGLILDDGDPEIVTNRYNLVIANYHMESSTAQKQEKKDKSGTGNMAKITNIMVVGDRSNSDLISSGENAAITVEIEAYNDIDDINVGLLIRDRFGQDVYGTNLFLQDGLIKFSKGRKYSVVFNQRVDISPGNYTITVAITVGKTHIDNCIYWGDRLVSFDVAGFLGKEYAGIVNLHSEVSVSESTTR